MGKCSSFLWLLLIAGWTVLDAGGCKTMESSRSVTQADPAKIDEAKQTLQRLSKVNDEAAESFYQQGLSFEEQGFSDEAAYEYLKAIKVKPSFAPVVYTQLGMLYREMGKLDLAQDALTSAVALSPNSALASYQLALVFQENGDASNAAAAFRKAIAINPDLADAHYHVGKILWGSDKPSAAQHFRRYLEIAQDGSKAGEVFDLLHQLPLGGQPIAVRQTLPPQKATAVF